jgi:hypothetical protein
MDTARSGQVRELRRHVGFDGEEVTVAEACASYTCSTSLVGGLSRLVRVQSPQIHADSHVHLFLQPVPRDSLMHVLLEREATLLITSCFRVLPEQMMLWRQYQEGRCGIKLAARPGSHAPHCEGIAVDVHAALNWALAFERHNWQYLGSKDPMHFQHLGDVRHDIGALGVRAFQTLQSRHGAHPLTVDGVFGQLTESALMSAPAEGWT